MLTLVAQAQLAEVPLEGVLPLVVFWELHSRGQMIASSLSQW